jgi:hypothetical protein
MHGEEISKLVWHLVNFGKRALELIWLITGAARSLSMIMLCIITQAFMTYHI